MGTLTVIPGGLEVLLPQMRRLMVKGIRSPTVRQFGMLSVADASYTEGEDQIGAFYDFIVSRYPYQPDPYGKELLISPTRIAEDYLRTRSTYPLDCDDFAVLTAATLGSLGYRTRVVVVSYTSDEFEHAYAEVFSNKLQDWVVVDLASRKPLGWVTIPTRVVYLDPTE